MAGAVASLWRYPPKSTAVIWKQEALELGWVFHSSNQMELSNKNKVYLKDLVFHSEFQKGIQRKFESQKEKKRNKKNLNQPEGFCITFRILEGNSKKIWKPKKKRKEIRRI